MQKIVLTVDNKQNIEFLINIFQRYDFIRSVEITKKITKSRSKYEIPKSKFQSWEEFDSIFGIWKDREITKEELRTKAWRIC